jgi:D-alanyl-D-alanine carboxypeptidase (penicillin-binding protein 5/6)
MKKVLLCALTITLFWLSHSAEAVKIPSINAHSAILMDAATGKVLFRKNSQDIMAPASTTKIMTGILALEKLTPEKKVRISKKGATREGTSLDLVCGEQKTIRELLYGAMLVSGNDAAVALAEAVSGSENNFARLMTDKAKLLGMNNTCFKNASGLPVIGHYSTAYDMALLTRYALKNKIFAAIVKTKYRNISGPQQGQERKLQNHNKLLWKYSYATGVKTGYTVNAGGCLVSAANRNGKTLIAVVLKTAVIYDDCIKMFNYGFGLR